MEYKQITLTEIYIPICFYFNPFTLYLVAFSKIFTFQYVSILITLSPQSTDNTYTFTFQYVSILIIEI